MTAQKIAKIIRTVTTAPILALALLLVLYTAGKIDGKSLLCGMFCLTVLPLAAYPLQPVCPHFRHKGREGQRLLAMIFAVSGYVIGCVCSAVMQAPAVVWLIYLEYLLSGLCILLFNKVFHLRASGHACGVAGPVALLLYFRVHALIGGLVVLVITWWASLMMRRHTWQQLLGGTCIPLAVLAVLCLLPVF